MKTTHKVEGDLQVGDRFKRYDGATVEVVAFSKKRNSRTQRVLPDGAPYKITPSYWNKVEVVQ